MNDPAVIDRLRTALDELTSEIDDDIPAFDDIDPAPPARRDPDDGSCSRPPHR
jgi:hypothetical protein